MLKQAEGGPVYDTVLNGQIIGHAAAFQLPNIPCRLVQFQAPAGNTGNFYLGGVGVTKPTVGTDATTGIQIAPGGSSGWLFLDNLSRLYLVSDNTADFLAYLALT